MIIILPNKVFSDIMVLASPPRPPIDPHSFSPGSHIWSLFAPIHMKSCKRYYLVQFGFIYPYLAPKYTFCPYLALLTYIYLYVAVFGLNYPYLGIFALNCPDFTICAIFTLYIHSSIETAHLCKILEQSDYYSPIYCISKIWGIQVSSANAVWVLI